MSCSDKQRLQKESSGQFHEKHTVKIPPEHTTTFVFSVGDYYKVEVVSLLSCQ